MKFYIPSSGDQLRLLKCWRFKIFSDSINCIFVRKLFGYDNLDSTKFIYDLQNINFKIEDILRKPLIKIEKGSESYRDIWGSGGDYVIATMPAFSLLKVNSICIRSGKKEYDSISFSIDREHSVNGAFGQFWVKIADVNTMEFEKFIPGIDKWISSIDEDINNLENLEI